MFRLPWKSIKTGDCSKSSKKWLRLAVWSTDPNARDDMSRPKLIILKRIILLGASRVLFGLRLHVV